MSPIAPGAPPATSASSELTPAGSSSFEDFDRERGMEGMDRGRRHARDLALDSVARRDPAAAGTFRKLFPNVVVPERF